jgi:hypothetical protein
LLVAGVGAVPLQEAETQELLRVGKISQPREVSVEVSLRLPYGAEDQYSVAAYAATI